MSGRVTPAESPPPGVVLPFFFLAPLGLAGAGLILLLDTSADTFRAVNLPPNVAITHALVLGWVTTTMMGALSQLGPAVLGGPLLSNRLARAQLLTHAIGVGWFVAAAREWDTRQMGGAGILVAGSLLAFILNAGVALLRGHAWPLPRMYVAASLVALLATLALGLLWVGTIEHSWFPITLGRLSAHAHAGLVGWIGLTLMGVSYQLVPMFNVATRVAPRFGRPALAMTLGALLLFGGVLWFDPAPWPRFLVAVALSAGPLLWSIDQWRIMAGRAKRRFDVQGRATYVSLGFLWLTAALGLIAASPLVEPGDASTRWTLAYGVAGIGGWAGAALLGNSYKILPFLIWFHRYRQLAGIRPVPVVGDIYSDRAATMVLAAHACGVVAAVAACLVAEPVLLRAAGGLLLAAGAGHLATMLHMLGPKHSTRTQTAAPRGKVATQ